MRNAITRAEIFAIARGLGAEPNDTRKIEIGPQEVTVATFRRDENGRLFVEDDEIAVDVTTIPIVGDPDAATVRLRHPGLGGREVDVPASAVPQHAMAGWEVAVEPAPQEEQPEKQPEPAEPPEPTASTAKDETPRRRRGAQKEGE